MNLKVIVNSVIAVLISVGLLFLDMFLFRIYWLLGIIGIILILVIPGIFTRKAIEEADNFLEKLIAKFITPALIVIACFFAIMFMLGWI